MGHYKVILGNNDIAELQVAMLNIGLRTGVALDRCKRTISVMLEKDKGKP